MEQTTKKWAGTTFGTAWMHEKLIGMLRHVDVRVFYAFTMIFVVPACLLFGKSRRYIYDYLRNRQGLSCGKAAWFTFRNHWLFSQVVVDKFAMYAGHRFEVEIDGYEHYLELEKKADAFVQLSSHIGNYEIAGYTLKATHKRFNALVFGGEKSSVMQERNRLLHRDNIHLIAVKADMSHLFEVNAALANNECVSMPADRVFGSSKSVEVTFMGCSVQLPLGPFRVATMRNLDVLAVNVMKTSSLRYKVYVTPLSYDKKASSKQRVQQLAQAYVAELECMLASYPEQWYNFFDFWKQNEF